MVNKNYITIVFIAFLCLVLIFCLSNGNRDLVYSTGRGPPLKNYYATPILITQSNVKLVNDIIYSPNIDNVLSPTRSYRDGTVYDVPTGYFSSDITRQRSQKFYTFTENGRRFGSIGEKLCCKIVEEFLEREVLSNIRPNFLKNIKTGRNLELDVYDPITKVAVEYDGPTHFKNTVQPFLNENEVDKQIERDISKDDLCMKIGIKLIRVPYMVDSGKKGTDGTWRYIKRTPEEREERLKSYLIPYLNEYCSR